MKVLQAGPDSGKSIRLDRKDKRMLYMLSQNARYPLTRIAAGVGLSREGVEYKLKRFIECGVITGFRTSVDINKLGYFSYHLFLELGEHTADTETAFVDFLKNHPRINAVIKYTGRLDFEIAFAAKGPIDADAVLHGILLRAGRVLNYEIMAIVGSYKSNIFSKRFFENVGPAMEKKRADGSFSADFRAKRTDVKLDGKDMEILRCLSGDSRMQLTAIAKKCGLSNDAVVYRIKKMIRAGIIKDFRPAINYAALGQSVHAVLLKSHGDTEKDEQDLKWFLEGHENVLWAVRTFGRWNVLIYLITQDQKEFHQALIDLRERFGPMIRSYETLTAYEEYKYSYLPDAVFDDVH